MLGPLTKVELPKCENFLDGKTTRKSFGKRIKSGKPL